MSDPYIGELRLVSFDFAPRGWSLSNGQIMAISQNQALFSLFGTMYGGNGQTTFALPNLAGRVAIHRSNQFTQGQAAGESTHTLTIGEMPAHTHQVVGTSSTQNIPSPANTSFASSAPFYGTATPVSILPADVSNSGGGQPHENKQPFLTMNWIVSLQGIFPSRN